MLSVVKLPLKGEVGICALKSHGNYIVDHRKSWKNHGIVLLNFCGNPDYRNTRDWDDCDKDDVMMLQHCHLATVCDVLYGCTPLLGFP